MEGFTVSNASKFLDTGSIRDSKSLAIESPSSTKETGGKSFADTLKDAVKNVNELEKASDTFAEKIATGQTNDIAGSMIAADKAEIAFKAMVSVRNKIIDAYQEVMKMQV